MRQVESVVYQHPNRHLIKQYTQMICTRGEVSSLQMERGKNTCDYPGHISLATT